MNAYLALVLLTGIGQTPINPLDGSWKLTRLEMGGKPVDAGHPALEIRDGRLQVQAPNMVLQLCADHNVRLWDPQAGSGPRVYCPYTPREWAQRFGDPTYFPGPELWVIEPVTGNSMRIPPPPCYVIPEPGPIGVYVVADNKLAVQLNPANPNGGSSLLIMLEKATLPQPRKVP
jgi:hypothetical protein